MSKPTPGSYYRCGKYDTIRNIARLAYGSDESLAIVNANVDVLSGAEKDKSDEGLPKIYDGTRLWLPPLVNVRPYAKGTRTADFENPIEIELDGVRYKSFKATQISRAMNEVAAGFVFDAPFSMDDKELVKKLKPFSYYSVKLFIDGEIYLSAICEKWAFSESSGGRVATIEARTRTGDLCECSTNPGTGQFRNMNLLEIAKRICAPYGIPVYAEFSANDKGKSILEIIFDDVVKEVAELDFDFLSKLATQAGYLMKPGVNGELAFTRAAVGSRPVASLRAGEFPVLSASTSFDGSKRFSDITGTTESEDSWGIQETVEDLSLMNVKRPFRFKAEETNAATLRTAVQWRLSQSISDSTAITVGVAGWRDQFGKIWAENTIVCFLAPSVFVLKETEFLIQKVVLTKDESGGDIAELSLVLPEAYTLGLPSSYPWEGKL